MSFSRTRWNLVAFAAVACVGALWSIGTARAAVTIPVNTQSDTVNPNDGHCSLREAVIAANTDAVSGHVTGECDAGSPSGTTISVPDGTYVLSGGQLQISAPVTITGTANHPTVFANNASRVLSIGNGVSATITGLEIAGGLAANGGGILNNGTLTLTDDTIDNNKTSDGIPFGGGATPGGPGAGLDNEGTATLIRVALNFNATGKGGTGGVGGNAGGQGAGIYNAGTLTLTDSQVTQNSTGQGGDGGTGGGDGGAGGGIFNTAGGTLTVNGGEISNNTTGNGGTGGTAGGSGGPGGGLEAHGTVSIAGASIASDRTGDGGTGGTLGGLGGPGAGIDAGMYATGAGSTSLSSLSVSTSTLASNVRGLDRFTAFAGAGGGAVNVDAMNTATVTIADASMSGTGGIGVSLVSERRSTGGTGAIQFSIANTTITSGSAGGVFAQTVTDDSNHPASLTGQLTYATITGNAGAGIANAGGVNQPGPAITTHNSVIASNGACTGTITDGGRNLSFGNAGCPGTNADPKLGTLGNHGGPTPTIPLLAGSPAIDAIPANDASCTGTDQRGTARPAGSGCDIGSYEVAPPKLSNASAAGTGTSTATVTGSVTPGDGDTSITARYGATTSYGTQVTASTLPAATTASPVSVALTGLAPGTTYHAQLVATSAEGTTTSGDLTFTTTPSPSPPPPGGGSTAAPRLSALTITPASFTAATRGPSIARAATGANIAYRDTLPAITTFTIARLLSGHRTASGTCSTLHVRKGHRAGRPCTKAVVVGQLRHIDRAGTNSFRFTGRLNGKSLVAGRYALSAIARLAGKASAPLGHTFTIRG